MYPNCQGACIQDLDISGTWSCNGKCQNKTEPCGEECVTMMKYDCSTQKCSDNGRGIASYSCNGNCIRKTEKCSGSCFVHDFFGKLDPLDVLSYTECPNHPDRCVIRASRCNRFDDAFNLGLTCPDLAEHSKHFCEERLEPGSSCSHEKEVPCKGARPGDCVFRRRICDGKKM